MKELKRLIQTKKIIALLLTVAFVILTIRGNISSTEFMSVFTIIIGFYFGQSTIKDATNKDE